MKNLNIAISLGVGLLLLIGFTANYVKKAQLRGRCYIHKENSDHPAKIKEVLEYGYIVQCKKIVFDHLQTEDHYILQEDFDKEYKVADCYPWNSTEEPVPSSL